MTTHVLDHRPDMPPRPTLVLGENGRRVSARRRAAGRNLAGRLPADLSRYVARTAKTAARPVQQETTR